MTAFSRELPQADCGPRFSRSVPEFVADAVRLASEGDWFRALSAVGQRQLLLVAKVVRYRRGQLLFAKGDIAGGIYVLLSGRVGLYAVDDDRRRILITLCGPGDVIGLETMMVGGPRGEDARADINSEMMFISSLAFDALVETSIELRDAFSKLSAQHAMLLSRAIAKQYDSAPDRLRGVLKMLASKFGVPMECGGLLLDRKITQEHIASLANTSRQYVCEELTKMEKTGQLVWGAPDGHIVRAEIV